MHDGTNVVSLVVLVVAIVFLISVAVAFVIKSYRMVAGAPMNRGGREVIYRFSRRFFSNRITVKTKKTVVAIAQPSGDKVLVWLSSTAQGIPDLSAAIDDDGKITIRNPSGITGWIACDVTVGWLNKEEVIRVWTERGGVVAESRRETNGGIIQGVIGAAFLLAGGVYVAYGFVTGNRPVALPIPGWTQSIGQLIAFGLILVLTIFFRFCSSLVERIFAVRAYTFMRSESRIGELNLGLRSKLRIKGDDDERQLALVLSILRVCGLPQCSSASVTFIGIPQI